MAKIDISLVKKLRETTLKYKIYNLIVILISFTIINGCATMSVMHYKEIEEGDLKVNRIANYQNSYIVMECNCTYFKNNRLIYDAYSKKKWDQTIKRRYVFCDYQYFLDKLEYKSGGTFEFSINDGRVSVIPIRV